MKKAEITDEHAVTNSNSVAQTITDQVIASKSDAKIEEDLNRSSEGSDDNMTVIPEIERTIEEDASLLDPGATLSDRVDTFTDAKTYSKDIEMQPIKGKSKKKSRKKKSIDIV